jgi:CheY-like chemotaxis protein
MMNVLLAEDHRVTQRLIESALNDAARCVVTDNGKMAYECFKDALATDNPFDLILLDISLPLIDGLELLRGIRQYESDSGIAHEKRAKIFMLTENISSFTEAHEAGCDDYVLKPIDTGNLLAKIDAKLGLTK